MEKLLKSFDRYTITSAGGIVVALFLAYVLYKVLTNDLSHISEAILRVSDVQQKTNEALIQNATAIEGNTKVLQILERRIK